MSTAKEPCPLCLAAPADWVDDPHETRDALFMALAELRLAAGVGGKPILSELPSAIAQKLWFPMETAPRDRWIWLLVSTGKEELGRHKRGAQWHVDGSNGCVIDISAAPTTHAQAALRWRPSPNHTNPEAEHG